MKILQKVFYMLIAALALVSCDRDYDAPPLNEPKYDGPKANITIASLKEQFSSATQDVPSLISTDLILRAYVSANDESGNIYKQIYLQDETGAIPILADYNGVYGLYRVGQEVYVNLKDLCISVYGDEQQIGIPGGNLYRLLQTDFEKHVQLNGWPDKSKVQPKVITNISSVNENVAEMTFRLVRLEGVYFVNGGKDTFAPTTGYGTQTLKDSYGNSIDVRTSNYAKFASETLPIGKGTVIAILGRFRGAWQVTIPTGDDFFDFDGIVPGEGGGTDPDPEPGGETVLFKETFGDGYYPNGSRPKIADFTDFDMKAPIVYSDASGLNDIRSMAGDHGAHAWFKAGTTETYLTISHINTSSYTTVTLTYEVAANLYNAADAINLNVLSVKCNGTSMTFTPASQEVSKANGDDGKFYTFTVSDIPIVSDLTIEFCASSQNTVGLRLDNIKLTANSGSGGNQGGGEIVPN